MGPRITRLTLLLLGVACAATACRTPSDELTSVEEGSTWVWGDLHAHSGWSYDGCEQPDANCTPRGETPAADFFEQAEDADLDFAALTDHAEADSLSLDGEGGPALDIWDGQAAVVSAARGGPVLPILGYEWTAYDSAVREGHSRGSHRTVLLSDPSACVAWRVPGSALRAASENRPEGAPDFSQRADASISNRAAQLAQALDDAAGRCPEVEALSFVHHSAWDPPEPTDWLLDENRLGDDRLIEIFSEHGSSECADLGAEGCDWATEPDHYYPDGAAQTALDRGLTVGFVGGTDSHDGRPGSLEDGPSAVAQWEDVDQDGVPDSPRRQLTGGGLTGVLLAAGEPLDAAHLFDNLSARRTLATSGPRPELRAAVFDDAGQAWSFGEAVPSEGTLRVEVELSALSEEELDLRLELIGPGGALLAWSADASLHAEWDPAPGDTLYLRARFFRSDGEEDRLWLSPWFANVTECTCGPPTPDPSRGLFLVGAVIFALVSLRRAAPALR